MEKIDIKEYLSSISFDEKVVERAVSYNDRYVVFTYLNEGFAVEAINNLWLVLSHGRTKYFSHEKPGGYYPEYIMSSTDLIMSGLGDINKIQVRLDIQELFTNYPKGFQCNITNYINEINELRENGFKIAQQYDDGTLDFIIPLKPFQKSKWTDWIDELEEPRTTTMFDNKLGNIIELNKK